MKSSLFHKERLLKLDLLSIKERALRGDFIEVYKIVTGKMDISPGQFFFKLQDNSITRGHHLKLKKRRACHHYRNMFFCKQSGHTME